MIILLFCDKLLEQSLIFFFDLITWFLNALFGDNLTHDSF